MSCGCDISSAGYIRSYCELHRQQAKGVHDARALLARVEELERDHTESEKALIDTVNALAAERERYRKALEKISRLPMIGPGSTAHINIALDALRDDLNPEGT